MVTIESRSRFDGADETTFPKVLVAVQSRPATQIDAEFSFHKAHVRHQRKRIAVAIGRL